MIRALKWAYDLGVRQERIRIASHLQLYAQGARHSRDAFDSMIREELENDKPNKSRAEKLKFNREIQARISNIVEDLFSPKGEWKPGASLMFPDDKHKGEV